MTSLDTFAELLARWQEADRPTDRFAVVTQAASDLRDLSATDARALAQGLLEHGAPLAAAQVARQAGHDASPEELTDVAQALLALDPGELGRFAEELRDPDTRERLLEHAVVWAAEDDGSSGEDATLPPPDVDARHEAAPPETVNDPGGSSDLSPVRERDPSGTSVTATDDRPAASRHPAATAGWREPPVPADVASLGQAVQAARTPQERWRVVADAAVPVLDGPGLRHLLGTVPDGWQRRTLLRRLLDVGRVGGVADPAAVVAAFGRDGDRFGAAAWLVAAGLATPAQVSDRLRDRDARRLRRRAT